MSQPQSAETPGSWKGPDASERADDVAALLLHAEAASVSRLRVETAVVRVARTTGTRDVLIREELAHETVEVTRVPIGRIVEAVPDVREEGDTTILPVVEEVLVVERRLVLKEEVHLRRVRTTRVHAEAVTLREQTVSVTRTNLSSRSSGEVQPFDTSLPDQSQHQDNAS